MDKNAIKKYAVWARTELIDRVSQKALQYGITETDIVLASATSVNGVVLSNDEIKQRKALIEQINKKGYEQVMEEVAYTWFNRFSALRFMEVNGYLPSRVRVFTDENNQFEPQIITEAIDLEMDGLDMEKVYAFKDANDKEGLFKYLIIVQCNALSPIMPRMFQRIADYTELLFPDNLLREGSVIQQMIELIPEVDWKDAVQIIGWLYQYYNTDLFDTIYDGNMSRGVVDKTMIPAATQLFTPDWVVKYMVENSLGRLWIEGHPNEDLKDRWKYYLEESEQETKVQTLLAGIHKGYAAISPEKIKCIDPCSGSGHILAYMFDVLMQIYETYGYTAREAVRSIVENNIYGLDIDERAAQLAYFSVMMKARQYDKRFLMRKDEDGKPDVPQPHVYEILESNGLDRSAIDHFVGGDPAIKKAINSLISEMHDAKEYGSILNISSVDFKALYKRFDDVLSDVSIFNLFIENELLPIVRVAEVMAQKYDIVVTNPPYLGSSRFSGKLSKYINDSYADEKSDLAMVMLSRMYYGLVKPHGFVSAITTVSWMYLKSFEKFRKKVIQSKDFINLVDFGTELFDGKVGHLAMASWVARNTHICSDMLAIRLVDFCYSRRDEKEREFFNPENRHYVNQKTFTEIIGTPFAYSATHKMTEAFHRSKALCDVANPKQGLITGDVNRFVRKWYEPSLERINLSGKDNDTERTGKWFPYSNGGAFRKWYGNNEDVVNWENNGFDVVNFVDDKGKQRSRPQNQQFYFRKGGTWSAISAGAFAVRFFPDGFLFSNAGMAIYADESILHYLIAFLNCKLAKAYLGIFNEGLNCNQGDVAKLPIIFSESQKDKILNHESECILLSKTEWDSFETSWDFRKHPLVPTCREWAEQRSSQFADTRVAKFSQLAWHYEQWEQACKHRFDSLKENEEELNRIFIDIYGLQDELTPDVADDDVTVRLADKKRDIKSLISYAVGCMFGRYSLDVEGLAYAGGEWDDSKYVTFKADKDNIIPICDDEYFPDDIVGRFVRFIEVVYGKETRDENLRFIADALGGSGQPVEVIRNYFLNDFYVDHLKIYQKRPIYWLFDSGKKNGFKALVYMHRYQPDTIARMRTDYVHEQQSRYRTAIADIEQRIASASTSERVKLNKKLKTLQDQATEIQTYEEKIHHLADQYISIDLDDGVKKNYAIFSDVLAKIK